MPRGDPTVVGWGITGGYAAVAVLCARAGRTAQTADNHDLPHRAAAVFWFALGAALLALALNKQLDLQSDVTAVARELAQRQGWYEHRRTVQAAFIGVMFLAVLVSVAASFRFVRHLPRDCRLALVGVACVAVFALLRATEFHHMADRLMTFRPVLAVLSFALEAIGGVFVGFAAWRAGRKVEEYASASSPA